MIKSLVGEDFVYLCERFLFGSLMIWIYIYPENPKLLKKQQIKLPLLFTWILLIGFTGLVCGLHLCHTGDGEFELSKEISSHEGHTEGGGLLRCSF